VYAPDIRGYNLSCKPEDPDAYRMRHLLGDVLGLVEWLELAPLSLVGHDWGGIVAWALALKYPELLERLVIIDAPPPFTWNRQLRESPKQRDAVNYMIELSKPSPEPEEMLAAKDFSMMDNIMRRIGGRGAELSGSDRATYHEAWAQPGALRGGLNYYPRRAHGRAGRCGWGSRAVRHQDHLPDGRGPDPGDLGGERFGPPPLSDPWTERMGAAPPRRDHLGGRPLGAVRAPG
jgi:pimeloyl-ACP methyl ester carboxylesterase